MSLGLISGADAWQTLERKSLLLALLLQNPGIFESIDADRVARLKRVRFPGDGDPDAFRVLLDFLEQTPSCTPARVLEHFRDKREGLLFGLRMITNTEVEQALVLPTVVGLVQMLTEGDGA